MMITLYPPGYFARKESQLWLTQTQSESRDSINDITLELSSDMEGCFDVQCSF